MIKVGYSIDLCIHLICDKTEIMLKHLRNGTCISLSIEYQFSFFKNQLYLYIHVKFIFDIHFFEFIVYFESSQIFYSRIHETIIRTK